MGSVLHGDWWGPSSDGSVRTVTAVEFAATYIHRGSRTSDRQPVDDPDAAAGPVLIRGVVDEGVHIDAEGFVVALDGGPGAGLSFSRAAQSRDHKIALG